MQSPRLSPGVAPATPMSGLSELTPTRAEVHNHLGAVQARLGDYAFSLVRKHRRNTCAPVPNPNPFLVGLVEGEVLQRERSVPSLILRPVPRERDERGDAARPSDGDLVVVVPGEPWRGDGAMV